MGDSRVAPCLQGGGVFVSYGTVTITSSSITGNTASGSVRARVQIAPMGRLLTRLLRLTLAQLRPCFGQFQDVRAAETCNYPIAPMGDSRFACCLQGGGVYVYSATVTITSSSIYGNTAGYVRARLQKFPSPQWDALLLCPPW
jgi:hypothetical protein